MRTPKYHLYLTNEECSEVLKSLIDLKNSFGNINLKAKNNLIIE